MPPRLVGLVSSVVVLAAGGCRDSHPFVPYSIEASTGVADASGDARARPPGPEASVEADAEAAAALAPDGASSWTLEGVTLQAPPGQVFVLGLVADFDGDGIKDAFAIVRPPDGIDVGQVAFFRGSALATPVLFPPPAGMASGPSCTRSARLVRAGARSVFAELGLTCPGVTGTDRWFVVLDVDKTQDAGDVAPRVLFAAAVTDPPGAPVLSFDAKTSDRDGDGQDDVALTAALEGGGPPLEPGPRVAVDFAWVQRGAGLSRERGVTEASFDAIAAVAASRAARAKDAPLVPPLVGQARALWRAVCADGGAVRLAPVAGTGAIVCGMRSTLAALGLAESRAYVTMGDAFRASLALDRAQRTPAVATASQLAEGQKQIAQIAPMLMARGVRAIAAVPVPRHGHEPAWGPLAFEPSGKLLVRSAAGVVRVDPEPGDEVDAPGVDWRSTVASPDGTDVWIEAYDPCDGLSLRATFATSDGDELREVALPVHPALNGRCMGSRGAAAGVVPVAWGPAGLEAIVDGEPVLVSSDLTHASSLALFLDQPSRPGAPRSPDGKTYVVATRAGIIVRGPAGAHILRAKALEGTYSEQEGCVVSDDAQHVACVRYGKAWVGAWGP
jgi:hypothetical protein